MNAGQSSAVMTLRNGCHKAIAVNSQSPKNQVRRIRPTHLIFVVLFGSCVKITPIEPRSIRADVATPAVAEVATSASDADAAAPTSATTPTPATAAETAATTTAAAATATAGHCLRGRCADQDGRGADEIDEYQSHRCDAACNGIIAFSHF
jgi:hypothetical protein